MKKKTKIITFFLLVISIFEILMLNSVSNATSYSQNINLQNESTLKIADDPIRLWEPETEETELTPNGYIDGGGPNGSIDANFSFKYGGRAYNFFYVIAIIVAVISIMIIGVKYIFGSVEEKADYKKNLIPIAIGIIFIVALLTIVSIVASVAEKV